jgi:hypothetical protein
MKTTLLLLHYYYNCFTAAGLLISVFPLRVSICVPVWMLEQADRVHALKIRCSVGGLAQRQMREGRRRNVMETGGARGVFYNNGGIWRYRIQYLCSIYECNL